MTWVTRRIEHLARGVRTTVDPAELGEEEVDHYSIPALDQHGKPERQPASGIQSSKQLLRGGEVLISRLNPRKARILTVPKQDGCKALASGEFVVLQPTQVDTKFLEYVLLSERTRQDLDGSVQSVTRSHQRIRPEQLLKMQVRVPIDADVQRVITGYLDTETARIDALIANKRRLIRLLEGRLAGHIRQKVLLGSSCRDPLQVSKSDGLAEGATPMKLSWLARFGSGTTPEAGNERYYGGSTPWVVTGDLNDGDLHATTRTVTAQALRDYSALRVHPAGSLVVAMYGATIGKLAVLGTDAAVNQACCVIAPGGDLDKGFLFFYLLGFRQELMDLGRGSGQPNISQETLRSLRFATPSTCVQRDVAAQLSGTRSKVLETTRLLERQIALLQEHRQALITAAVTES